MRIEMRIVTFMLITSFISLVGWQELGDSDASRVRTEIEASVKQASKAWEEFPKSMDRASLLKHYAADYSGVKDGASETLKDVEKSFDDLAEQIKLGNAIGISYKITELNIQPFTRRTYQDETKLGRGGALLRNIKAKCSTPVRKEGESWLVFHEHCSTVSG
jgi:hypothetical protein